MTYNNSIDSELKLLNILVAVFIHQDEDPENLNQDSGGEIIELKCTPFLDQLRQKKTLKTSKCPVARRKCQTTTKLEIAEMAGGWLCCHPLYLNMFNTHP